MDQIIKNMNCKELSTKIFEYTNVKDDLIEYKCLCCNRNYQKKFDENLKKCFVNTYKFLTMIKNLSEYHYLYVQSYTLLLAIAFRTFGTVITFGICALKYVS